MRDLEMILNHCLNDAMCSVDRIKFPSSNNISLFITKWLLNKDNKDMTKDKKFKERVKEIAKENVKTEDDKVVDDTIGGMVMEKLLKTKEGEAKFREHYTSLLTKNFGVPEELAKKQIDEMINEYRQ